MPDKSWTLTVSYVNGVASITDPNGGTGDETIFRGESDQVTFQPGTGVRAVTAFVINSPVPLPTGVTITQQTSGSSLVILDTNSLVATADEVDVSYCISFTDSSGVARSTDPQLVNKPTVRPDALAARRRALKMLKPMPRKPAAKPAAARAGAIKLPAKRASSGGAKPKAKTRR